ncbi:phosphotransferase [Streptomyces sp. NPDC048438]|uniref:phosphotransferase n=1 Tax=Streptomyces sp. NPDC048438 TaxID=3365551 RepID=UPI00371A821A
MRDLPAAQDLSGVVREALGAGCRILGVERLRGGSKKGVYRVRVDAFPVPSVIVYRWAEDENFWPDAGAGQASADPFAPASGLAPFLAAQRELARVGARAPRVLSSGSTADAADFAVVQDVTGGTLEELFETDPVRAASALADLAGTLELMQRQKVSRYGRVGLLERDGVALGSSCEQVVLDRALRDLAEAADRDVRVGAARGRLGRQLNDLRDMVRPRTSYGLIHGELGPDHVLVGPGGEAVLIDIEGLMYFDVEWEHVFLRIRFGRRYAGLSRPGLDPRRIALYAQAMRLSLVAGPLRLLDGDFPDREFMRGIAEHNLSEALAELP